MGRSGANRVIVITGEGKGKTTAALGLALRASGHGLRVCVLHFIKNRGDTGEARALAALPGAEAHRCGLGFMRERSGPVFEAHARAAREGLRLAAAKLRDPAFGLVVLDEVCGAVALGLLPVEAVCAAVAGAAPGTIIVLTGRDAAPELTELADTVSRITCVRHGLDAGWPAQAGVEF